MDSRRSTREFSDRPVPREVIENLIKLHLQLPCTQATMDFASLKIPKSKKIRIAAEEEEMQSYESRMSSDWLDDLKPLGTDWRKPF
jgi:hypothetical protein